MNKFKSTNQSDKDFSGLDFADVSFVSFDFHETVFNGVFFTEVKFINCNLQNTEFTEAIFLNCTFINCNLNHSDFIYTKIEKTRFEKCSFSHVEWRENNFLSDTFTSCSFYNSTISLCTFKGVTFDLKSSKTFCGNSKRYNVFSQTALNIPTSKLTFLRNNFGIVRVSEDKHFVLDKHVYEDSLFSLSVHKYLGLLNTKKLIELIIESSSDVILNNYKNIFQKLKYLSLINRISVNENEISVFGLQLLIKALNALCQQITDTNLFMEIADLIMFLKTTQFNEIRRIESQVSAFENEEARNISIQFRLRNNYSTNEIKTYSKIMSEFLIIPLSNLHLGKVRHGSTIFQIIITASVSVGTVLLFINFSLAQLNKSLEHIVNLKKNSRSIFQKKKNIEKDVIKVATLVPISIMVNEGNVYYNKIEEITTKFGIDTVILDGKADVSLKSKSA